MVNRYIRIASVEHDDFSQVFSTPLKKESKSAVSMLKDSSHYVVMITGDSPLTACYVANQLKISKKILILTEHGKFFVRFIVSDAAMFKHVAKWGRNFENPMVSLFEFFA